MLNLKFVTKLFVIFKLDIFIFGKLMQLSLNNTQKQQQALTVLPVCCCFESLGHLAEKKLPFILMLPQRKFLLDGSSCAKIVLPQCGNNLFEFDQQLFIFFCCTSFLLKRSAFNDLL